MTIETVGHRGAAGLVPENTLPSFAKAIELGCDRTECDVRLTRDQQLVIMHDQTVDRTTNGSGAVADLTLAELRALDAGGGQPPPTFDEVLDLVADRIGLLCELKGPDTAAPAVEAVRRHGLVERVIFTCFDFDRLADVRALGDELHVGGIMSQPDEDGLRRLVGLRAVKVGVHWRNLTREFCAEVQGRGLLCRGWNPDTEEDIRHTIGLGVNGVCSNRPDILVAVVRAL